MKIVKPIDKKYLKRLCENLTGYLSKPSVMRECTYQYLIYNGSDRVPKNDCRMCCYAGIIRSSEVFECIREDRFSGATALK